MMILNRKDYYNTEYVLFQIIPQLKYSYLSVRKNKKNGKPQLTRYYLGYNLDLLKKSIKKLGVFDDSSRMYYDLPIWQKDGLTPMFSFNNKIRTEEKKEFNKNCNKYFKGYHFAIDIDSDDDIERAWKDTKKIKNYFDEKKIPYSLKFSGSRGFHFIIDDKWFPKIKASKKVINAQRLANVIMNIAKLKSHSEGGTFDDSIYDDRRIFKLAYSLCNNKGKEYVCLPLSDEQFDKFKIEDMEMLNVIKNPNVRIFKRGLLERDYGLTQEQLQGNFNKFLKEVNYG